MSDLGVSTPSFGRFLEGKPKGKKQIYFWGPLKKIPNRFLLVSRADPKGGLNKTTHMGLGFEPLPD